MDANGGMLQNGGNGAGGITLMNIDNTSQDINLLHGHDNMLQQEITLTAKNTATLDEYHCRVPFQSEFVSKLEKWIQKRRYQCHLAQGSH